MSPSYTAPKEHIERIRQEKFSLTPDGSLIDRSPLAEDLHRAVEELAQGLYSKDIHFVLELIQNAEDNHYAEDVKPDLTFVLLERDPTGTKDAEGALLVVNNELGFRPDDVEALCAVGHTTKKEKREGYIGEKGIGFKSVFRVSSRPHIFSAGYQFRFQREPDTHAGLGFIVPYWVPEIPALLEEHKDKTCILLPLDPGRRDYVAEQLEAIAPETILFLRKLQSLTIQLPGRTLEVLRDDTKKPLVEFLAGDRVAEYWVTDQQVAVPPDLHEEKRLGIESRTVSVACFLEGDERSTTSVFAFLPTEVSSGYPFLVNADFLLSASRESIQVDRKWNQWLRGCIAPVFVRAFEHLVHHPEHKFQAYKFIPLVDNVPEFFQPPIEQIYAELKEKDIIWTFQEGALAPPAQSRLVSPPFRKLLSTDSLPAQLCETPLVHPKINAYRQQLEAIGVSDLPPDEIVRCLEDDAWLEAQSLEWFIDLYSYLQEQSWATRDRLEGLRLLPLASGERVSAEERPVYFPCQEAAEAVEEQARISSAAQLAFLSPELYSLIEDDGELCKWLAAVLGVREWTQDNYCRDLARMLQKNRDGLSTSELVALTRYIRDQYESLGYSTQWKIEQTLPLLLADGSFTTSADDSDDHPLVMPASMDPDTGWQLVFPDPADRAHMSVLADDYLADCRDEEDVKRWCDFLEDIGATEAPAPRKESWWFDSWWNLPSDFSEQAKQFVRQKQWDSSNRGFKLRDYLPPLWLQCMDQSDPGRAWTQERAHALLRWVEVQIDWLNSDSSQGEYHWFYRTWHSEHFESSLRHRLQKASWFPSTQGPRKPSEVFLDKPELREIFGDLLPYALVNPDDETAEWLNLRKTATAEELVEYLKELASQPATDVDREVVTKIYAFLSERWESMSWSLQHPLEHEPLILVRRPTPRWVKREQAVWPNFSAVFGNTYAYLEDHYEPHLRRFFVDQVGVADQLEEELYAQALDELAKEVDPDPEAVEASLERIYPVLLRVAKAEPKPSWWSLFCRYAKIWTQNDRFERAANVYLPDDGDLKRLFAKQGVEFAWRPAKATFADYEPLYTALGVRSLTREVEVHADLHPLPEDGGGAPLLTPWAKRAICWYLWNTPTVRPMYEQGKESALGALLRCREQLTEQLELRYELGGCEATISDGLAYFQQDEAVLYRLHDAEPDRLEVEVSVILAKLLSDGGAYRSLEDLIGRMLGASEVKAKAYIQKHNWSMPPEEKDWIEQTLASAALSAEPPAAAGPELEEKEDSVTVETGVEQQEGPEPRRTVTKAGDEPPAAPEPARRPGVGPGHEPPPRPKVARALPSPPTALPKEDRAEPQPASRPETEQWRPRLRSYVEQGTEREMVGAPHGGQAQAKRDDIEQAGIEAAIAYERLQGRMAEVLNPNHPGWDIDSYEQAPVAAILDRPAERKLVRRIEVKATRHAWDGWGVGISSTQHREAQKLGADFYLYVVEHALDPARCTLYVFQNPVAKISDYRFDDAWRKAADETVGPEGLQEDEIA